MEDGLKLKRNKAATERPAKVLLPPQVQHAKRFSHGVGDQFGKTDKKLSATNIDHRGHLGVKLAIAGLNLNPSSADFDSILRKAI